MYGHVYLLVAVIFLGPAADIGCVPRYIHYATRPAGSLHTPSLHTFVTYLTLTQLPGWLHLPLLRTPMHAQTG